MSVSVPPRPSRNSTPGLDCRKVTRRWSRLAWGNLDGRTAVRMNPEEQAAAELAYARERLREKGREDLIALLETGEITVNEAFIRLHRRAKTNAP